MNFTLNFQSLLESNLQNRPSKPTLLQNHGETSNNYIQLPSEPVEMKSFDEKMLEMVNQLRGLSNELTLIRPLYISPPHKSLSSQPTSTKHIPKLHHDKSNNQQHSIITTMLHTLKRHALSTLPQQWIAIIDQSVKEYTTKVSDLISIMRKTCETQRTTLDNLYLSNANKTFNPSPLSSSSSSPLSSSSSSSSSSFAVSNNAVQSIPIVIDRKPIEKFIQTLQHHHAKLNKGGPITLDQQREYVELASLSYQSLQHREIVLLLLEGVVIELGTQILTLERERKAALQEQSKKMHSDHLFSAFDDATDITTGLSILTGTLGSSLANHNHKGRRSPQNKKSNFNPSLAAQQDDVDAMCKYELTKFGLSFNDLELEKKDVQTSIEHEEYALSQSVEQNMQEIAALISTFQAHVLQQSDTIYNIYKDVEVANYNIDTGNTSLEDALIRGTCSVWFYSIIFLGCAFALLILDFLFN